MHQGRGLSKYCVHNVHQWYMLPYVVDCAAVIQLYRSNTSAVQCTWCAATVWGKGMTVQTMQIQPPISHGPFLLVPLKGTPPIEKNVFFLAWLKFLHGITRCKGHKSLRLCFDGVLWMSMSLTLSLSFEICHLKQWFWLCLMSSWFLMNAVPDKALWLI